MSMSLTVRLTFANGDESVTTVRTAPLLPEQEAPPEMPPYRLADATAPEEPTLVASPNFLSVA